MNDTERQYGILVIDDDPNNVDIMEIYLEEGNYKVFTASDGVEGWDQLQQHKSEIRTILLDRMMPNMNGMQFMEKLKADDSVNNIPVIMQTAAAEKQQVTEGITAGVYYYLTKPYNEGVMLSIVRAAISSYADYSSLRKEISEHKSKLHLIKESFFEVVTLDDAKYLSTFIANLYPDPDRVIMGLAELLINAIEHGNLGISYQEKTLLMMENIWEQEIQRRLVLAENQDKKVLVHFKKESTSIYLHIKDQGKGFDWLQYLEIDPDRATHNHGRGVALAKMISFDSLEYQGCGNEVVCTINLTQGTS